ncbi:MAG: prolyl oligopeptidase family protein [Bacteroidales bacterium]
MIKNFITSLFLFFCILTFGQKYEPVITNQKTTIDTFFNKYYIEDKYRWLENTNSVETIEWVETQDKQSDKYLSKASDRTNSYSLIDRYSNIRFDCPSKMGDFYFSLATYNDGVPALFIQSQLDKEPNILVDPNRFSIKEKIRIRDYSVSKDSKLLAYQYTRDGSDWQELKVVSTISGIHTDDHLVGLKFSNIAWMGNGFFYTTYSQQGQFGVIRHQRVYYHKIGDDQSSDKLIFEDKDKLSVDLRYLTTSDEQYFILEYIDRQKGSINYFYIDYKSEQPELKPLVGHIKRRINILDSKNGKFIATTKIDASNGSIVEVDPSDSVKLRTIVPEQKEMLLLRTIPFNDRMVVLYQTNQRPIIRIIDYSGKVLYTLKFPLASSVGGFSGNSSDEDLLFNYTTYTIPPVVYKFNIKTFKKELARKTSIKYDIRDIEYKEVEYYGKDSVKIPMILVYKKGIKLNGKNPTILKAYGGFGIVETPYFDPGIVFFVKQGGIYAFANIRGGGDKGADWAFQGRGKYKQNSFDDFISAADFLIKNKYTSNDKLAATGASNGGLVVAAAGIQRPDLFKVLVPEVAPLDMLRFEKFTAGHWWVDEYGTVTDSVSFRNILAYSPYQNIKEDINYPSMLVVTSENDDRVPPLHSYKFTARLQSRAVQSNPILLKVEKDAGHNGATTFLNIIKERADIYGFILNELTRN